ECAHRGECLQDLAYQAERFTRVQMPRPEAGLAAVGLVAEGLALEHFAGERIERERGRGCAWPLVALVDGKRDRLRTAPLLATGARGTFGTRFQILWRARSAI